ncbi:MAG: hypothetical protein P4N41_04190 [Negativicutes bacterium]|nr:hypothetical protein [Negativicutes bacterium]
MAFRQSTPLITAYSQTGYAEKGTETAAPLKKVLATIAAMNYY